MQILLILAHPDSASLNHAIANRVRDRLKQNGHQVWYHDLYQEQFDPLLPAFEIPRDSSLEPILSRHCYELATCDGIVIIHPNWWGQPPAILTGWVDRVVRPGIAYQFVEGDGGEGVPVGLLRAKAALVLNTSNTAADREDLIFGDPLERIWKDCIFGLCGVNDVHRKMFRIVVTSSPAERERWLCEAEGMTEKIFPAIHTP
ncbi:MAG TPA: NAD(P)H-dependent oxidoreductase [Methanospirillum sp.]|nr:NAD(P)H-dependent oxidoreductase [Methanospirillum sp.]